MAKKYNSLYTRRAEPVKAGGPYYGDLTEGMIEKMVADAPRGCDDVIWISRRTNGKSVHVGFYDMRQRKFHRSTAPPGWGPGYY